MLTVRVFYHNQPRYRLLLEVIAGADLEEVLSTWPLRRVTSLLTEAQVFTWYALYAGPPLGESTVLASFPTVRLLAALQLFDTHGTEGCASWNDFLDLVDKSALASKNNFGTADDVRLQSLKMIATIVSQMEKVASPVMATHFNRVLCCQYELISKRFGSGYASLYGNPEHGNPLEGIDDEVARAILWVKQPDPLVRAWSNARNQLLYKYSLTATDRTNLLRQWFDPSSS